MDSDEMYASLGDDDLSRRQAVFASVFVLQNRLQTACDALEDELTMKQWLALAMTTTCSQPPTLTLLGRLMGSSRQNAKKLVLALEQKGFVRLEQKGNATSITIGPKAAEYEARSAQRHQQVLDLLFQDFDQAELAALYGHVGKLYSGIGHLEELARKGMQDEAESS